MTYNLDNRVALAVHTHFHTHCCTLSMSYTGSQITSHCSARILGWQSHRQHILPGLQSTHASWVEYLRLHTYSLSKISSPLQSSPEHEHHQATLQVQPLLRWAPNSWQTVHITMFKQNSRTRVEYTLQVQTVFQRPALMVTDTHEWCGPWSQKASSYTAGLFSHLERFFFCLHYYLKYETTQKQQALVSLTTVDRETCSEPK